MPNSTPPLTQNKYEILTEKDTPLPSGTNSDDVSGLLKYDFSKLRELCNTTTSEICSTSNIVHQPLNKISTQSVVKNSKITKTYLFDQLKKIVKVCNQMCDRDSNTANYFSSNSCKNTNIDVDVDSDLDTCRKITEAVEASLKKHSIDIERKFREIKNSNSSSSPLPAPPPLVKPPSPAVTVNVPNPTEHIKDYRTNFITEDVESKLNDFLSEQNFENVRGRSVINYGEPYIYNGSPKNQNAAVPIPEPIKGVMDEIKSKFDNCDINQCTVNKYCDGSSGLSEHSDDERIIKPDSLIFSVSLGSQRDIKFRDVTTGSERVLTPDNRSLYVMSQPSQFLWTHRIDPVDPEDTGKSKVRYSLTFRCVGQSFVNSCIILGDSNTQHLSFGSGKGQFGESLPGKRIETFHIRDIDAAKCIGYKNIVVHVGINDLRDRSPGKHKDDPNPCNIRAHFDNYIYKIAEIKKLCPKSRLIVSPILPTKLMALNDRACHFNRLVWDYVARFETSITILDVHCFLNQQGLLDDYWGIYKKPWDKVHLGIYGIRMLAKIIKNCVKYKYVGPPEGRSFSSVLSGQGVHDWPPLQT